MGEDVTLEFIEVEMWMKIGMSGCDPLGGFAGFRWSRGLYSKRKVVKILLQVTIHYSKKK